MTVYTRPRNEWWIWNDLYWCDIEEHLQKRNNADGRFYYRRTSSKQNDNVVGYNGEVITTDNDTWLAGIFETYSLRILNTVYRHKNIHKYTWHQASR